MRALLFLVSVLSLIWMTQAFGVAVDTPVAVDESRTVPVDRPTKESPTYVMLVLNCVDTGEKMLTCQMPRPLVTIELDKEN